MVPPRIHNRIMRPARPLLSRQQKTLSVGSEFATQVAVMAWARQNVRRIPELRWLHSSLNGAYMPPGVARKQKAAGMVAGIWDLFLPCSNHVYTGLYLEMKHGKNKLTEEQIEFGTFVESQGYKTAVAYSFEEATKVIEEYFS